MLTDIMEKDAECDFVKPVKKSSIVDYLLTALCTTAVFAPLYLAFIGTRCTMHLFVMPAWPHWFLWTVVYVMMGAASLLVLTSDDRCKFSAAPIYVLHLGCSCCIAASLVYIPQFGLLYVIPMITGICTFSVFGHISNSASWLMFPHFFWVTSLVYRNLVFPAMFPSKQTVAVNETFLDLTALTA